MNKKTRKILFIILPILLGFFLIWYSLNQLTNENIVDIKYSFKNANYLWVVFSLFLGGLSHLSRAYRWKYLLEPLGYNPKFTNSFLTVFIAYFLNLFIPRSGEVARAAAMDKYENIPFEKGFGSIVAERISDVIMLLLIMFIAFILQTDLILPYFKNTDPTNKIIFGMVGLAFTFVLYKVFKESTNSVVLKIKNFLNGLLEGVLSILKMKKKISFILHTIFIWTMYILMFYVVSFALPQKVSFTIEMTIIGFVVGAISMALTNGGLGFYPHFVMNALMIYLVPKAPALAFGWIMWTSQTIMVLLFGGLSLILLPIYNKDKN